MKDLEKSENFLLVVAMIILRIKEVVPIMRDDDIGNKNPLSLLFH